jgi:hypothetical protein
VRDADHLEAVADLPMTAAENPRDFICQGELRERDFQVPILYRHILGLDAGAQQVNDIEALRKPHEILEGR